MERWNYYQKRTGRPIKVDYMNYITTWIILVYKNDITT